MGRKEAKAKSRVIKKVYSSDISCDEALYRLVRLYLDKKKR